MASNPSNMSENEFTSYLAKHGISDTKQRGDEISFPCPFGGCDDDHRSGEEFHCSFNCKDCTYHCFKCGASGNYITLQKHFGDYEEYNTAQKKKQSPAKREPSVEKLAKKFYEKTHEMEEVRDYFNGRGINSDSINKFMLGAWNHGGRRGFMIPILNKDGNVAYVKIRRAPEDESVETVAKAMGEKPSIPKYSIYPAGTELLLVGEDQLRNSTSDDVLICEGELDRIIAIQEGVKMPVVTAGGAQTFKNEWINSLEGRRRIYICLDSDEAGENGFKKLAESIIKCLPLASVYRIALPFEADSHADLTDYFTQKKGTADELFSKYAKYYGGAKPIDVSKFKEMSVEDIARTLDLTIKFDFTSKVITFLAMLLAYTEDCQINVIFNASSSTGKTYICSEVAKLFPPQDVKSYGKTTPNAFYYNESMMEKDEKTGDSFINLERRILIFSEQPNPQLLENLRAFLSHDNKRTPFLITNKQGNKNTAKEGYLLGFSTTLFCSANMRLDEQEQTRSLILSPDTSSEKIRKAVEISMEKGSNKKAFNARIDADMGRKQLMDRIRYIKSLRVDTIDIEDRDYLDKRFYESVYAVSPEVQRKVDHFMSLVKAMALLNAPFRRVGDRIVATNKDVDEAMKLWLELNESARYGVAPQLFDIYKKRIVPAYLDFNKDRTIKRGITFPEYAKYHFKEVGKYPNIDMYKDCYLPTLEGAGLIQYEKSTEKDADHRYLLITPLEFFDNESDKKI